MATSIVAARPRANHPQLHAVARRLNRAVKGVDERLARVIVAKALDSIAAGPMTFDERLARFAQANGLDDLAGYLAGGMSARQAVHRAAAARLAQRDSALC